jgi:hypothetical protein
MSSIRLTPIPGPRDGTPPDAKGSHEVVPIDKIVVPDGRRPPRNLPALAEPIAQVGLLNPVTLTPGYRLIAGGNRLAACRTLGWTHLPAVVVPLDGLRAELAELDENLIRHDLSALERGEALARRKALYEALHPETRPVSERGGPGRGRSGPKTNADSASVFSRETVEEVENPTPSFTADVAARTGQSRRTVQTEVQIAERIPAGLRDSIRGTPLAHRKDDLLKLARLDPGRRPETHDPAGPRAGPAGRNKGGTRGQGPGGCECSERRNQPPLGDPRGRVGRRPGDGRIRLGPPRLPRSALQPGCGLWRALRR